MNNIQTIQTNNKQQTNSCFGADIFKFPTPT